jgi:prevent-host-death family protein
MGTLIGMILRSRPASWCSIAGSNRCQTPRLPTRRLAGRVARSGETSGQQPCHSWAESEHLSGPARRPRPRRGGAGLGIREHRRSTCPSSATCCSREPQPLILLVRASAVPRFHHQWYGHVQPHPPPVLRGATFGSVKTISQRELRNDNAEVIRGVEAGESYTVTRRGVPVALVVPLRGATDLRCDRPAKRRPTYAEQRRVRAGTTTTTLLEDLRGEDR